MKKILTIAIIVSVVLAGVVVSGGFIAKASTPTLSTQYTAGNGDLVQVTVNGDPSSSVFLYFRPVNSSYVQSQYIGTTDYSGYLAVSISTATYNITPSSSVYVLINNQVSPSVVWPYSGSSNTLSLSQTSLTMNIGQTSVVTAYNSNNSLYVSSNSNSSVASATTYNNQVTIVANSFGTTQISVCSNYYYNNCSTIYVTVQSGSNNTLSLSQSSVSVNVGSNASVTIYGSGTYYISSNTNSSVASTYLSGNTITITGNSYGTSNINICQNGGQCAILYVTVGYNGGYQTITPITFSQSNPNLTIGQSINISIYGGYSGENYYNYNNGYYVAYNSNTSSVQTTISGNSINLYGLTNSATVIVVCSSSSNCGAISVSVGTNNESQSGWIYCASENNYCYFSGTKQIRYGIDGAYTYGTFTNSVMCSNANFGDPAFKRVKQCSYSN